MGLASEFKTFAMKGNVVDMAVGVIIGGAFGAIVTSLVSDVMMPIIGTITGGKSFVEEKLTLRAEALDAAGGKVPAVTLNYGAFADKIVYFLIVAFCLFLVIKAMNAAQKKTA